jgi:hypothetical protein
VLFRALNPFFELKYVQEIECLGICSLIGALKVQVSTHEIDDSEGFSAKRSHPAGHGSVRQGPASVGLEYLRPFAYSRLDHDPPGKVETDSCLTLAGWCADYGVSRPD